MLLDYFLIAVIFLGILCTVLSILGLYAAKFAYKKTQ